MVPLGESATSDAIGDAICKVINDSGLTLSKLIGIGVDGCRQCFACHISNFYNTNLPQNFDVFSSALILAVFILEDGFNV
jgi:hypothetical protein